MFFLDADSDEESGYGEQRVVDEKPWYKTPERGRMPPINVFNCSTQPPT